MQLSRIHHVSINVTDLAAALEFYVDRLGLAVLDRPEIGVPGAWLDAGEQQIHLLAVDALVPVAGQHFAFEVTDLDDARAVLQERGVRTSEPSVIDGVCVQSFLTDPSGNLIELNQQFT